MSMQFLSTIKSNINSQMPDNSSGLITPSIMRSNLNDMVDSLYYRSAVLLGDHSTIPITQVLTTTPTNYPNLYTAELETDSAVVTADILTGICTPLLTGFICEVLLHATMNGANGRVVTVNLSKNNIIQPRYESSVTLSGAGKDHNVSVALPTIGVVTGDIYKMLFSIDTGASIDFTNLSLILRVIPTFSPV